MQCNEQMPSGRSKPVPTSMPSLVGLPASLLAKLGTRRCSQGRKAPRFIRPVSHYRERQPPSSAGPGGFLPRPMPLALFGGIAMFSMGGITRRRVTAALRIDPPIAPLPRGLPEPGTPQVHQGPRGGFVS
jgi:hypothetical protein